MEFDPLADPCFTCKLWENKINPCIGPKVYKKGGLVLVGEAPGENEDKIGDVFVGKAGDVLRLHLQGMGVTSFTLLNAVRCRPTGKDRGNRAPTAREVAHCSVFLAEDLQQLNPTLCICLGATAAKALGLPHLPLKELRHRSWWVRVGSEIALVEAPEGPRIDDLIPVRVTHHPAAHMRPGKVNLLHEMQQDLEKYVTEYRALTGGDKYGILNIEMEGKDKKKPINNNTRTIKELVLDIETTGFLKGYKALPFDKGDILLIGWDEGEGYTSTTEMGKS